MLRGSSFGTVGLVLKNPPDGSRAWYFCLCGGEAGGGGETVTAPAVAEASSPPAEVPAAPSAADAGPSLAGVPPAPLLAGAARVLDEDRMALIVGVVGVRLITTDVLRG